MGASASSVYYNIRVRHPTKEVPIIDYDLALLFQPMLMIGITIGVSLSVVFPYWLITVLIIILFIGTLFCPLIDLKEVSFFLLFTLFDLKHSCLQFVLGTSSRSAFKGYEMWKEETIMNVNFQIFLV